MPVDGVVLFIIRELESFRNNYLTHKCAGENLMAQKYVTVAFSDFFSFSVQALNAVTVAVLREWQKSSDDIAASMGRPMCRWARANELNRIGPSKA